MNENAVPPRSAPPDVEVVVPVYNEEHVVADNVRRLHAYLSNGFPYSTADHDRRQRQSSDATFQIAHGSPTSSTA